MTKDEDDFELEEAPATLYPDLEVEPTTLTEAQEAAVRTIQSAGFRQIGHFDDILRFAETRDRAGKPKESPHRRFTVGVADLQSVASGLETHQEHEEYSGVTTKDGAYVEFLLQAPGSLSRSGRAIERREWDYQEPTCDHVFNPRTIKIRSREYKTGFHLESPRGHACIELSEISAIAKFLILLGGRHSPSDYTEYTFKVMLTSPGTFDANIKTAQQIADGILFELDAKRGITLNLIPREYRRTTEKKVSRRLKQTISFPSTILPREVAALFSFAAEATENPPFAFLSYYQILEYYMPLTSRRDALKRIRREIRDFSFDISDDTSVLRVLNAAERAKGLSEEEALKILVRDCVREDRLIEFLRSETSTQHFSRKGPIGGVPAINLNATNETIAVQVAKRVYALRNRIVHAKDDPKYSDTPQLLPRSIEANSLDPDILLARFLALETIIDTQD
ncbi:hypothetical protein ACK1X7_15095 [Streptomyces sp. CY1]|uniref:hypothetical protein n=1 Tax=Streptomyces sp. CY1 TaxID=3388313 RepID=UPI00399F6332